jgi:trehalose/maltose hydrolase-like predicted phosphorylase
MDFWKIRYDQYEPGEEPKQEALCTLGNGYFATRGAAEESKDDGTHYPGTYLAGGYNRLESEVEGKLITNEDFVNWPNWLMLTFKPEGGDWLNLDSFSIINYEKALDLENGLLIRNILFKDKEGRETELISTRFVHMNSQHLAGIHWKLKPVNWSGKIEIKSALDGKVINNNVARYRQLNQKHLEFEKTGQFGEDGVFLQVKTLQSKIQMTQAMNTRVYNEANRMATNRTTNQEDGYVEQVLRVEVVQNKTIEIEKIVSIYTSRDNAITAPAEDAINAIRRTPRIKKLLEDHVDGWQRIWNRTDIKIRSEQAEDQLVLRLHIFHLMQVASKNAIERDIGIPSRGLHGEAYRGHILWDELFIFPFINFSIPEITRELLMYRYRRLPAAEYAAEKAGYRGAMFPWQSGSNGREESQEIHLNPKSGKWIPDNTYLQRHVNAAIAYNIWQYFEVNQDMSYLSFYGAELFLQIAKFWASKVSFCKEKGRYQILNVVGPDEYHTHYPDSDEPGINNNAYTNVMAVWVLARAFKVLELLSDTRKKEMLKRLKIDLEEMERWEKITRQMYVPFIKDGIIEQFEGFTNLQDLDWQRYHEKYGEVLRLDRILESENDDVNNYKAAKQADVLMLFYLLSIEELESIFSKLGYEFNQDALNKNIDYYDKVTSHGSTLSKLVHSWVMAKSDRSKSWHNFRKALMSDFKDIQGGTTSEGIHLGAMAGTIDLMQRCYLGLEIRDEKLIFNPVLPKEISYMNMRIRYRNHWLKIQVDNKNLKITSEGGWNEEIAIYLNGNKNIMAEDEELTLALKNRN